MRAKRTLRAPAAAQIAAGALILALPTAAAAAVVSTSTDTTPTGAQAAPGTATTAAPAPAHPHKRQRPRRSRLSVHPHTAAVLGGEAVSLKGRLLPAAGGRIVHLITRDGGRWHQLAWARTGRHGGFKLHFQAPGDGTKPLRVLFAGNKASRRAIARAGSVTALHDSVASWYDDAGNTACGFHAYYGVANKTLPCGTHVTMSYGGHTVTATVDDRGPFVPGRDYDLNQNTARALGMFGVATVMSSI
jgi:rare lipoprotein A